MHISIVLCISCFSWVLSSCISSISISISINISNAPISKLGSYPFFPHSLPHPTGQDRPRGSGCPILNCQLGLMAICLILEKLHLEKRQKGDDHLHPYASVQTCCTLLRALPHVPAIIRKKLPSEISLIPLLIFGIVLFYVLLCFFFFLDTVF